MDAFFKDCLEQVIEDLLKLIKEGVSTDYEDWLLYEILALLEGSVWLHIHGLLEISDDLLRAPLLTASTWLQQYILIILRLIAILVLIALVSIIPLK